MALRDRAIELYAESEREHARWIAATCINRPRHRPSRRGPGLPAAVADIASIRQLSDNPPTDANDLRELTQAAVKLHETVQTLMAELASERNRSRPDDPDVSQKRVEGHELIAGDDGIFFLASKPVNDGTQLFLLTEAGWIPGRYDTRQGGEPRFYFALPGALDHDLRIVIPRGARLAWEL